MSAPAPIAIVTLSQRPDALGSRMALTRLGDGAAHLPAGRYELFLRDELPARSGNNLLDQQSVAILADDTEGVAPPAVGTHEVHTEVVDVRLDPTEVRVLGAATDAFVHGSGVPQQDDQGVTPSPAGQGDTLRQRTPTDYAIEHAGYLVTAANQLLEARNELDGLFVRQEDGEDVDDDEMQAAREGVGDATHGLRIAIHEFQKRRDRALAARQPVASNQSSGNSGQLVGPAPVGEISEGEDGRFVELYPDREVPLGARVYLAPPAQAVDLTAVRSALDAAEGLAVICASVDGYSRDEVAATGRAMTRQFTDARALIDGQAGAAA